MPFTLAHPAVVVPLAHWRRVFVLPALVVGSMAPDFEYFVRLGPTRTIGHTLVGIPLLCVPTGLVVLWVFEHVMKGPLVGLLPIWARRRLGPHCRGLAFWPAGQLARIVASLVVGAVSHIAWDSVTHGGGWLTAPGAPLAATWLTLGARKVSAYRVLQHSSTLVGLALLAGWSWRWLRRQPVSSVPPIADPPARLRRGVVTVLAIVPSLVGPAMAARAWPDGREYAVGQGVIGAMTTFVLLALAYSLGAQLGVRSTARRRPAATIGARTGPGVSARVRPPARSDARD
jgi:hypothetical protein